MDPLKTFIYAINVTVNWHLRQIVKRWKKSTLPIHVLFFTVDHYEPGVGNVKKDIEIGRVDNLLEKYPSVTKNYKDSYGNKPKRTWFFPPHYHRFWHLKKLVHLCGNGYGEIELHLHHGKTKRDTEENLKETLKQCIKEYSVFGIFGEENGYKKYGFIHGDWALDNSLKGKFCGVNNELMILKETGCYADFTFPACGKSNIGTNPIKINKIFYAKDNPDRPRSHIYGKSVRFNGQPYGDLMLIQGPLFPFFSKARKFMLKTGGDAINGNPPVDGNRIDKWVQSNIHVDGKNNIIFIKTHTHGATDEKAVLGEEMQFILSYLENNYNDGKNYVLHYITAREAYNIAKAIEFGKKIKEPEMYKNFLIKKPHYDATLNIAESTSYLKSLIANTYKD